MHLLERLQQNKYIRQSPTGKQLAFLSLDQLEALFGGAAGGGKSSCVLMSALLYVDIPGYNAIIIRDSLANLEKADALMPRSMEWLAGTDAYWKGDKKRWIFPSGATLEFGYMEGPRDHFNYQGAAYQFVGIDEAVNTRERQAMYMFSRLRKLKGVQIPIRFRLASNPPSREQASRGEWVKRRYVDKETREPGVVFIPSKLQDNPYLDAEEYIQSLNKLDPITRAQLLYGDWDIEAAGEFFRREWFRVVDSVPEADVECRVRFWDLAASVPKKGRDPDWTAGALMCRTKHNQWYLESVVRFQKTPRDTERLIRQVADMDGKDVAIRMEQEGGSSGLTAIDHYSRYVLAGYDFRGKPARDSKTNRAAPFASQLEAGNLQLVRGAWNKDFIDEAILFPIGAHDDQIDAVSGAYDYLTPGKGGSPGIYVFD